jgi:hypothetical protein
VNRRSFLRGLGGIAVGLPLLESLGARSGRAAPITYPKRLVVFFTCNGAHLDRFFPKTPYGALTAESFAGSLKPLASFKDKLLIPRGLHMVPRGFNRDGTPGDDHAKGMGHKLTAQPLVDNTNKYAAGISIDQEAANQINPKGRSAMTLMVGGASTDGLGVISYKGRGEPVRGEPNPRIAFDDLMGVPIGDPAAAARLKLRRESVLDAVKQDFDRLKRAPLSKADLVKLDAHFTLIRQTELGMDSIGLPACTLPSATAGEIATIDPTKVKSDAEFKRMGRLQMDVMAIALACGSTNVASLQWGGGAGGPVFRWDGMSHIYNHHKLSHGTTLDNGGDAVAGYEDMIAAIDNWYAQQFAYLLTRLSSYTEGSGTLLDNSVVVWGNELSDGKDHDFRDLPFVLAGSAGGYFKTGQYVKVTKQADPKNDVDAPHNMLLTTLLNSVGCKGPDGMPLATFGSAGKPGEIVELKA